MENAKLSIKQQAQAYTVDEQATERYTGRIHFQVSILGVVQVFKVLLDEVGIPLPADINNFFWTHFQTDRLAILITISLKPHF